MVAWVPCEYLYRNLRSSIEPILVGQVLARVAADVHLTSCLLVVVFDPLSSLAVFGDR